MKMTATFERSQKADMARVNDVTTHQWLDKGTRSCTPEEQRPDRKCQRSNDLPVIIMEVWILEKDVLRDET